MTHSERVILKKLIHFVPSTSDPVYCSSESDYFSLVGSASEESPKVSFAPLSYPNLLFILHRLEDLGYLELEESGESAYFSVTYKGMHHFQYSFDDFRAFFVNNFVCGFASGVASTLLGQYILRILGILNP
jgi:hypothetical protein